GYIVEPRNIQALVDAMLRVIADPTTAARLGEAARKTVESRFSVEQVNAQLLGAMGMDRQGVNVSHPPVTTATAFAGDL
ncbi:MAG: glycosyltransferase family 1 protein, partial [Sphingobium sp.]